MNNSTGYKGVTVENKMKTNKFRANLVLKIGDKKFSKFIGYYKTPEMAALARMEYIDKLK